MCSFFELHAPQEELLDEDATDPSSAAAAPAADYLGQSGYPSPGEERSLPELNTPAAASAAAAALSITGTGLLFRSVGRGAAMAREERRPKMMRTERMMMVFCVKTTVRACRAGT